MAVTRAHAGGRLGSTRAGSVPAWQAGTPGWAQSDSDNSMAVSVIILRRCNATGTVRIVGVTTRRSGDRGGPGPVAAVVAVALTGVAAAYFAPLGDWVADNPLPGQEWMKQHTGLALLAFAVISVLTAVLARPRRSPFRSGQKVIDHRWDPATDGRLADLRGKMRTVWINEFLACSLERIVPAQLGFRERRDAISGPLRLVAPSDSSIELDKGTGIVEIFRLARTERRLVVLGEPGAGKTTQLLRLAEHLLDDDAGPVPIVLSLSAGSWKVEPYEPYELSARRITEQIDLAVNTTIEWLAGEIGHLYQVPSAKVQQWLEADTSPIVLLLDGLDEVRDVADRRRCIEVLSLLRVRLNTGMVVCSRSTEYLESERLLEFGVAAEISALSHEDIDEYLADAGPQLASLRTACSQNTELATLLNSPLALTVAVLTYQGKQLDEQTVAGLLSNRLDHLWGAYLREALPRRRSLLAGADGRSMRFNPADSARYICGLARLMERGFRDNFTVDELNLSWARLAGLSPRGGAAALAYGIALAYGVVALSAGVALTIFAVGATGIGLGLICVIVLIATAIGQVLSATAGDDSSKLKRDECVADYWDLDLNSAGGVIYVCTCLSLLAGISVGILGGLEGILVGILPGVVAGATMCLLNLPAPAGIRRGIHRSKPQRRTLLVRATAGLSSLCVAGALTFLLINLVSPEIRSGTQYLMLSAATGVWLSGFAVSMHGWWSHQAAVATVIRHGILPRDIDEFLSHAEERIVMRRVLTGHVFLHRTLQAHLAETTPERLLHVPDDPHPPSDAD